MEEELNYLKELLQAMAVGMYQTPTDVIGDDHLKEGFAEFTKWNPMPLRFGGDNARAYLLEHSGDEILQKVTAAFTEALDELQQGRKISELEDGSTILRAAVYKTGYQFHEISERVKNSTLQMVNNLIERAQSKDYGNKSTEISMNELEEIASKLAEFGIKTQYINEKEDESITLSFIELQFSKEFEFDSTVPETSKPTPVISR